MDWDEATAVQLNEQKLSFRYYFLTFMNDLYFRTILFTTTRGSIIRKNFVTFWQGVLKKYYRHQPGCWWSKIKKIIKNSDVILI